MRTIFLRLDAPGPTSLVVAVNSDMLLLTMSCPLLTPGVALTTLPGLLLIGIAATTSLIIEDKATTGLLLDTFEPRFLAGLLLDDLFLLLLLLLYALGLTDAFVPRPNALVHVPAVWLGFGAYAGPILFLNTSGDFYCAAL